MASRRPGGRSAFGIALGHLQAVLALYGWRLLDLAPPVEAEGMTAALGHAPTWLAPAAQGSQIALGVALLSGAWLAGRSPAERLGALAYATGVMLAVRYMALVVLIGWPETLQAVDGGFGPLGVYAIKVWVVLAVACAAVAVGLGLLIFARRSTI